MNLVSAFSISYLAKYGSGLSLFHKLANYMYESGLSLFHELANYGSGLSLPNSFIGDPIMDPVSTFKI